MSILIVLSYLWEEALSPAIYPVDQAHCKLYPPLSPATSMTSPAKNNPGIILDSKVSDSLSLVLISPILTCEDSHSAVVMISNFQYFNLFAISVILLVLRESLGSIRSLIPRLFKKEGINFSSIMLVNSK